MIVERAIELRNRIYERNCVGCCLHIVTDDGNLENSHVRFCVTWANRDEHKGPEHDDCRELANLLLGMSKTQRKRVVRAPHKSEAD